MLNFLKKCECILDAMYSILKKYVIPVLLLLLLFIVGIKLLGYDTLSSELMKLLRIEGEFPELLEMIAALGVLWILSKFLDKYILRMNESKDEYRDYLIKELGEVYLPVLDHSKESETSYDNEKHKNYADNVIKTDKKDIIALMLKNNDEITEYFKISKFQAKSSFWVSVVSCIVGMGALVVGIYGCVILKDISVSVICLISGSISELISGTVFWVHNKSALQLNHYYDALHENEKFLSAINIADKLSMEKREEILVEIIYKQIGHDISIIKTENDNSKKKKNKSQ